MNLKCLLEILIDKELIEEKTRCTIEGKDIYALFEFKYTEVFDKICDSKYDKDEVIIEPVEPLSKNEFYIINVSNLEYGLDYLSKGEEVFTFHGNMYGLRTIPVGALRRIIDEKTMTFRVDEILHYKNRELKLVNILKRKQRIRQEEEDKKRAIEFLNQLP